MQIAQMEEKSNVPANLRSEPSETGSATGAAVSSVRGRKGPQGSHMSLEELRINKGLLKEISKKKKLAALDAVPETPELPNF